MLGIDPSAIADSESLSQKVIEHPVGDQNTSSDINYWEYTEQLGLQRCVADMLDKLKRYALPWLDDPNSKDLWPSLNQ